MDTSFKPGDCSIKKLWINSKHSRASLNIIGQCLEFSLYEDLSKPFLYAELLINDAAGTILEGLPLIGEELLEIEIATPGLPGISRDLNLLIYSVQNVVQTDKLKSSFFILKACSPSLLINSATFVSKGYKAPISTIVRDLIKNYYQYQNPIEIENTKGTQEIVIPKLRPLQAIDFLKRRAVSSKNKSSSFVFFENQNGLYFLTLEELIQNNKIGHSRTFFYDSIEDSAGQTGADYRSIIEYKNNSRFNPIDTARNGGVYSSSFKFDLLTKTINPTFQSFGGQTGITLSGNPINTGDFYKGISSGQNPALPNHFIPQDSSKPDSYIAESRPLKDLYIGNFQNFTTIMVHGDTSIKAGEIVNLALFKSQGSKTEKPSMIAGSYLITKLRHRIVIGNRVNHKIILGLVRNGYQ